MSLPTEAIERWRRIEFALDRGEPLPDDLRDYLLDLVRRLNTMVVNPQLQPTQVASAALQLIGLTPPVVRAYRKERLAEHFGSLFEIEKTPRTAESVAAQLASIAKVDVRTVYRWGARARAQISQLISSRSS